MSIKLGIIGLAGSGFNAAALRLLLAARTGVEYELIDVDAELETELKVEDLSELVESNYRMFHKQPDLEDLPLHPIDDRSRSVLKKERNTYRMMAEKNYHKRNEFQLAKALRKRNKKRKGKWKK